MSLKGSQTRNTSGCCQNVFVSVWVCAREYIYSKLHPEHNRAQRWNTKYVITHRKFPIFKIVFINTVLFLNEPHFIIFLFEGSGNISCQRTFSDWSLTPIITQWVKGVLAWQVGKDVEVCTRSFFECEVAQLSVTVLWILYIICNTKWLLSPLKS